MITRHSNIKRIRYCLRHPEWIKTINLVNYISLLFKPEIQYLACYSNCINTEQDSCACYSAIYAHFFICDFYTIHALLAIMQLFTRRSTNEDVYSFLRSEMTVGYSFSVFFFQNGAFKVTMF